MPVAMISTRTSPALGPSRSSSTISSGCLASNATAARVFMSRHPLEYFPRLATLEAIGQCGIEGESMAENDWLQGRHALITGGGTGIGAATAAPLHAAGANISVLGRRLQPLQRTAAIVDGTAIQCDVTDRDAIVRAFDEARGAHGPIAFL